MKEKSTLEELSDLTVVLPWAYDNSVCQTRSVTNLYAASLLINAICYGDEELKAAVKTAIDQNRNHMQMIALTKALATGVNPDAPTGLNAYITLK